jgi:hypothetical protein
MLAATIGFEAQEIREHWLILPSYGFVRRLAYEGHYGHT